LIGFFVNQLAFRIRVDGNPDFRRLIARVRTEALDAYDHSDLPFERLVEALRVERTLRRAPIFQVKLIDNVAASIAPRIGEVEASVMRIPGGTAKLDLVAGIAALPDRLEIGFNYNRDLFTWATADSMLDRYQRLFRNWLARPDAFLSEILAEVANEERDRRAAQATHRRESGFKRLREPMIGKEGS
jgi:non-ribosomal peptide synthetase component F